MNREFLEQYLTNKEIELFKSCYGRRNKCNFYGTLDELENDLEKKNFFFKTFPGIILLIQENEFYKKLYYFFDNYPDKDAINFVNTLVNDNKSLISEYVAKNRSEEQDSFLSKLGFALYKTYLQIVRNKTDKTYKVRMKTEKATKEDVDLIYKYSLEVFDPLSDRIPTREELNFLIGKGWIDVIRIDGKLAGFNIFEDYKKDYSYGRSLYVAEQYRGTLIGHELLVSYFNSHNNRIVGWARDDNTPALRLDEFFNYIPNGIKDYIFKV